MRIFLLVGVPGVGKSWVGAQIRHLYNYVPNDDHIGGDYLAVIERTARAGGKNPVLCEAPFSISQIKEPLESKGFQVIPVFILEKEPTLKARYRAREGKEIPPGHLTRQRTYRDHAEQYEAFSGTSAEVLDFLKSQIGSK